MFYVKDKTRSWFFLKKISIQKNWRIQAFLMTSRIRIRFWQKYKNNEESYAFLQSIGLYSDSGSITQAAEDKRRIKEERENAQARAKSISRGEIVEDDGAMGEVGGSDDGELENEKGGTSKGRKDLKVDSESIAGLSAKIINVNLKRMEQHAAEISEEEPEEEIPVLVHHDLPNLVSVLEMADVVLQVLDARDPLSFRIKHVEEFANDKGKKSLFVLNKIGGSLFSFVHFSNSTWLSCVWQIGVRGRLLLCGRVTSGQNNPPFFSGPLPLSFPKSKHRTLCRKWDRARARRNLPLLMPLAPIR